MINLSNIDRLTFTRCRLQLTEDYFENRPLVLITDGCKVSVLDVKAIWKGKETHLCEGEWYENR